jgi:hypothetical protein
MSDMLVQTIFFFALLGTEAGLVLAGARWARRREARRLLESPARAFVQLMTRQAANEFMDRMVRCARRKGYQVVFRDPEVVVVGDRLMMHSWGYYFVVRSNGQDRRAMQIVSVFLLRRDGRDGSGDRTGRTRLQSFLRRMNDSMQTSESTAPSANPAFRVLECAIR